MKTLITVVITLSFLAFVFFKVDPGIVNWFVNALPPSAHDWLPILRIIGWIIVVMFTGGITVGISILLGLLIYDLLSSFSK